MRYAFQKIISLNFETSPLFLFIELNLNSKKNLCVEVNTVSSIWKIYVYFGRFLKLVIFNRRYGTMREEVVITSSFQYMRKAYRMCTIGGLGL